MLQIGCRSFTSTYYRTAVYMRWRKCEENYWPEQTQQPTAVLILWNYIFLPQFDCKMIQLIYFLWEQNKCSHSLIIYVPIDFITNLWSKETQYLNHFKKNSKLKWQFCKSNCFIRSFFIYICTPNGAINIYSNCVCYTLKLHMVI